MAFNDDLKPLFTEEQIQRMKDDITSASDSLTKSFKSLFASSDEIDSGMESFEKNADSVSSAFESVTKKIEALSQKNFELDRLLSQKGGVAGIQAYAKNKLAKLQLEKEALEKKPLDEVSMEDFIEIENAIEKFSDLSQITQSVVDQYKQQLVANQKYAASLEATMEAVDKSRRANESLAKEFQARQEAMQRLGLENPTSFIEAARKGAQDTVALFKSPAGRLGVAAAGLIAAGKALLSAAMEFRESTGVSIIEAVKQLPDAISSSIRGLFSTGIFTGPGSILRAQANIGEQTGRLNIDPRLSTLSAQIAQNFQLSESASADLVTNLNDVFKGNVALVESNAQFVADLAKASNIAPKLLLDDIAKSASMFAGASEKAFRNFVRTAAEAKKLGITMQALDSVADNLLNFESSLQSEFEVSALLGRRVDLQRAREAANRNDLATVGQEIVSQFGSNFEDLTRIQQNAVSQAIGLSKDELLKLSRRNAQGVTDEIAKEGDPLAPATSKFENVINSVGGNLGGLGLAAASAAAALLLIPSALSGVFTLGKGGLSKLGSLVGLGGAAGTATTAAGSLLARGTSIVGKATPLVGGVIAAGQEYSESGSVGKAAAVGGTSIAGGFGGRALGAAIGTAIAPGIGTAIGGVLGGVIGSYLGSKVGEIATDNMMNTKSTPEVVAPQVPQSPATFTRTESIADANSSTKTEKQVAELTKQMTDMNKRMLDIMQVLRSERTVQVNIDGYQVGRAIMRNQRPLSDAISKVNT